MTRPGQPLPPDESAMRAAVDHYLTAFGARDLDGCLELFADDARLDFQTFLFEGKAAIGEWHRDRFAANLRLVKVERVTVRRETVTIDAVVASDRLAAWKVAALPSRVTLRFMNGRILEGRFAARVANLIDLIRAGD